MDRLVAGVQGAAKWLALPIILLLCLQWPLRDGVRAYSREANDLGQWLFALYVAIAVSAATRSRTHLTSDLLARRWSPAWQRRLQALALLVGLLPWTVLILVGGWSLVSGAVAGLERFPDTNNPFYWVVKLSVWILALFGLAEGLLSLRRQEPGS